MQQSEQMWIVTNLMKKNGTLNQKFNFDKQKHHNIIIGQMQFFFFL